jgi:hypothetical protein
MTITLPLQPEEEARLVAVAHAKSLSTDALVRAALDRMLADATGIPDIHPSASVSGADLVAAMQASPYKEIALEPRRGHMPVRDVAF